MQLVILAAGMGSRFGGLKQMEPMDDAGNFILDYSVFDALKAGFDSVIFVIKREHLDIFRETIGKRVEPIIKTEYAFQELTDLPEGYSVPEGRVKPWGTAHALWAAREFIKDDFIIINGDDYYGQETYKIAYDYLTSVKDTKSGDYANIAFKVINTMTENGSVKRGVCFYGDDHYLTRMVESSIEFEGEKIKCSPLDETQESFYATPDQLVSMNLFVFKKDIINHLGEKWPTFLANNITNLKSEFLIPEVVSELVKESKATLKLLETPSVWFGVTYKEDKPLVVSSLAKLVEQGLYKKGLY